MIHSVFSQKLQAFSRVWRKALVSATPAFYSTGVHEAIQHVERIENILRSTHTLDIPEETFYNFFMRRIITFRERIAFIDGISGGTFKYSDIYHISRKFATCIQKHGFKENDVMGILSVNRPEYATVLLGVQGCRGILTTLNPNSTVDEIVYQVQDSGAKMLVVDEQSLQKALRVADIVGLDKLFVFDNYGKQESDVVSWNSVLRENSDAFPQKVDARSLDDTILLLYSSGTTGRPKGVMLTHKNIVTNILQSSFVFNDLEVKASLGLLPFFHCGGLILIMSLSLYDGKQIVLLPNFQPETYLETVLKYKVDRIGLVPPLFMFNVKHPLVDKYDSSHIREFTVGAAPCAVSIIQNVENKFPNVFIRQVYGMTETSPLATSHFLDAYKTGSAGIPIPNTELKIEDVETRHALGPNQLGEICMRGPHVMKGYWRKEAETKELVREDGWLLSGDVGYYDEDHHLYIVDRLKELIKHKGLQVAPAELEDLLLSHPSVADAAVIGIPDKQTGEVPKAFIVRKDDITEAKLLDFVSSKVAKYKWIRGGIEFVDTIPKSASGKILRRLLREIENRKS